jgi:hypothetical protein
MVTPSSWFPSTGQGQFVWTWGAATTDGLVLGPIDIVGATKGFTIEIDVTGVTGLTDITLVSEPTGGSADALTYTSYPLNQKVVIKRESCKYPEIPPTKKYISTNKFTLIFPPLLFFPYLYI